MFHVISDRAQDNANADECEYRAIFEGELQPIERQIAKIGISKVLGVRVFLLLKAARTCWIFDQSVNN
jgi:hypothetical protein